MKKRPAPRTKGRASRRTATGKRTRSTVAAEEPAARQPTEKGRRESEEPYRSLFENSMLAISQTSPEGELLRVNLAYARMYGYASPEEMMAEVPGVGLLYADPEDRQEVLRILSENGVMGPREIQVVRRDGTRFYVEVLAQEIRDVSGRLLCYQASHLDITERKRAEEALRESERRLIEAQRIGRLGNWEWIPAEDKVIWSAGMYAIFGIAPETGGLTTERSLQAFHPEDRAMVADATRRALKELKPQPVECRILKPDGTIGYVYGRGEAVVDAKGQFVKMVGIYQDITERKRAEEALRESEAHYRSLLNMLNGFAYCRMLFAEGRPHDFTYLEVNQAFETLTGLKNVVGKNVSALLPGIRETDQELLILYGRVALTGVPERLETYVNALDMWLSLSVWSPRKEYFVVVFDDITERKRAEEVLREREAGLAAAQRIAQIGSWRWDVRNNTARWSDETFRIFGLAPGPLEDHRRSFVDLVHPADRERVDQALADALNGIRDYDLDYRLRLPDGVEKVIHADAEVVRDGEGAPVMMQGTVHDITERKRAEAELRELSGRLLRIEDEERRRLARELHDTTAQELVAISMNLAVLKSRAPELTASAKAILAETAALTDRCANEVRTFSYLLHPPALEALGLAGAVRDYADGFARRSNIRVDLQISGNLGRLPAEAELALFRVLQESLANIHRHSGSRTASIRLTRTAGLIHLEVRDTGRGMNMAAGLPAGGLGVGIPGMRERLRQFGGQLKIESGEQGTCVIAILPLDRQTDQP